MTSTETAPPITKPEVTNDVASQEASTTTMTTTTKVETSTDEKNPPETLESTTNASNGDLNDKNKNKCAETTTTVTTDNNTDNNKNDTTADTTATMMEEKKDTKLQENNDEEDKNEQDLICCVVCKSAVDYSDKTYFCPEARRKEDEEDRQEGNDDPKPQLLPLKLYNPHNALVFCDGCDRPFHQHCHFVPMFTLPRNEWYCLICTSLGNDKKNNTKSSRNSPTPSQQQQSKNNNNGKHETKKKQPIVKKQVSDSLYTMPKWTDVKLQQEFEYETRHAKLSLLHQTEFRRLKSQMKQTWQSIRMAESTIRSFITTLSRRRTAAANPKNKTCLKQTLLSSQELCQTFVRWILAKRKCRHLLLNAYSILQYPNAEIYSRQPLVLESIQETGEPLTTWFPFEKPPAPEQQQEQEDSHPSFPRRIIPRFGVNEIELGRKSMAAMRQSGQNETTDDIPQQVVTTTTTDASIENKNHDKIDDENGEMNGNVNKKQDTDNSAAKPNENNMNNGDTQNTDTDTTTQNEKKQTVPPGDKSTSTDNNTATTKPDEDDNDSGITLDDLKCCICFRGDASDENDLILCDGRGCFRSYHMQCLHPPLSGDLGEEDQDWFCPLCTTMAQLVSETQEECCIEEEEEEDANSNHNGKRGGGKSLRKMTSPTKSKKKGSNNNEDEHTHVSYSWDGPQDVFPEVEEEYKYAMQWKSGQLDDECKTFLIKLFGCDQEDTQHYGWDTRNEMNIDAVAGDDDDDDEDFDLSNFYKERQEAHEDDKNDDSDHSSQATLQDMSSVECKIGRSELSALSCGEEESSDDDEDDLSTNEKKPKQRRSRRLRSTGSKSAKSSASSSLFKPIVGHDDYNERDRDMGKLDEQNILKGKRRRRKVDYRRLNDSLFDGTEKDLDDKEEFEFKYGKHKSGSGSSSEGSDNNDDDDDDEEEEESDNEEKTSKLQAASSAGAKSADDDDGNDSSTGDEEPQKITAKETKKKQSNNRKKKNGSHVAPKRTSPRKKKGDNKPARNAKNGSKQNGKKNEKASRPSKRKRGNDEPESKEKRSRTTTGTRRSLRSSKR